MALDDSYYEAKGVGFWNCTTVVAFGEVCGRSIPNNAYDIQEHMRRAHPFRHHDDRCDSDKTLRWLWDWIDPDDPPLAGDGVRDAPAMVLLCEECYVMVSFTTIRPGNLAVGVI